MFAELVIVLQEYLYNVSSPINSLFLNTDSICIEQKWMTIGKGWKDYRGTKMKPLKGKDVRHTRIISKFRLWDSNYRVLTIFTKWSDLSYWPSPYLVYSVNLWRDSGKDRPSKKRLCLSIFMVSKPQRWLLERQTEEPIIRSSVLLQFYPCFFQDFHIKFRDTDRHGFRGLGKGTLKFLRIISSIS